VTTRLAATRVAAVGAPDRSLVMLHGIYGRGRNWQAIARAVVAARPEYGCWLVDLP
jgi:pimeloyl-ACP methyl ester carboxylesterase